LLTSGDRPGDLVRFREQRVNAHLLKPIQQDELLETIYRVMSRTTEDKERGRQGDKEKGSEPSISLSPSLLVSLSSSNPLNILVAEDNEFNAQLLEQLLVRRGHRVRLANNGREALSQLGIRSQESGVRNQEPRVESQQAGTNSSLIPDSCLLTPELTPDSRPLTPDFDLLLLDVHMPELDGFQVAQAVRERERIAGGHLPVIALTARARKEDRERCLAAGMDDFLTKPIQSADLWAAIDRVMATREKRRSKIEDRRSKIEKEMDAAVDPQSSILDPRALLAVCGGDAVILEKICEAFRDCLPDQLTAVQDALREEDTVRLRESAHKLCGMVAAFSTVAGEAASELEDQAAQGRLEEARPLVEKLETMADELMRLAGSLSLETLRQLVGQA
jgi:CheY-like chemotaxis protein